LKIYNLKYLIICFDKKHKPLLEEVKISIPISLESLKNAIIHIKEMDLIINVLEDELVIKLLVRNNSFHEQ
jgi:hypothetical protein